MSETSSKFLVKQWNHEHHTIKQVIDRLYITGLTGDGAKTNVVPGKDIHVGFLTVYVAKGYDSGNTDMNQWLSENLAQYNIL